jgi:hypothetical protein
MEDSNEIITLSSGKTFPKKVYSEYTKEELTETIKCCKNYTQVLRTLKISKHYHNYIKKFINNNTIAITHFKQQQISKPRTIEEIMIKNAESYSSKSVKNYLLKNKLVNNECSICKIPPIWNNNPLTLQLDHINGDHYDNSVENLRLICPNCHTQTDTYTGRNTRTKQQNKCLKCSKDLRTDNVTGKCAECIGKEKHLCSICKINKRPGNNSKCTVCRKKIQKNTSCVKNAMNQ